MASVSQQRKQKKAKVTVSSGKVYINATFNNTQVYVTDLDGNVLCWATAGGMGFKGSRKSTPFAAQQAASKAAQQAREVYGLRVVDILIKGPGPGREAAARAASNCFDKVTSICDITGIAHNGVRGEKERRV